MVLINSVYDIQLYDGSKQETESGCDGTLLTEKIILTAAHCFRLPLILDVPNFLYKLVSDKCELQKCHPNPKNEECLKAITGCMKSQYTKCGINMDANEKCKELVYYWDMMTKVAVVKRANVEAG